MSKVKLALELNSILAQVETYRGRVVPYPVWLDIALDTLDGNFECLIRWNKVGERLCEKYLAGKEGFVYLECLPQEEIDGLIQGWKEHWADPSMYEHNPKKGFASFEKWMNCLLTGPLIATDEEDPDFSELHCDALEMSRFDQMHIINSYSPGWILDARAQARDPGMIRLNRKYGG